MRNLFILVMVGLMSVPGILAEGDATNSNELAERDQGQEVVIEHGTISVSTNESTTTQLLKAELSTQPEPLVCDLIPDLPGCGPCGSGEPETGYSPIIWSGGFGFWVGSPDRSDDGLAFGQFSNYRHVGLC